MSRLSGSHRRHKVSMAATAMPLDPHQAVPSSDNALRTENGIVTARRARKQGEVRNSTMPFILTSFG
jgi:hypothetical protein